MSSTYTPGNGVPLPEQQKTGGGCLKWGGISAGILILLGLAGSCGGSDAETVVETETVTVTTGASASAVTTTATTTVTATPDGAALEDPSSAVQEPVDQPAVDPNAGVDAPEGQQRAQFVAPAPEKPAPAPAQSAYYPNCAAARSAGVAPLYAGDPGYSSKLDRDGDGVACE